MHCSPLDVPFGARLHLENDGPLDVEDAAALRAHFAEHGFLLIREGALSEARQIELLAALGRIEPDADGRPMRMEVTNQHDQTSAPDGELIFHYDYAYDPAPIPGISMYGSLIEDGATPTCFASSATVLDRLPDSLVEKLRGLRASHACFLNQLDDPEKRNPEPDPIIPRGQAGWGPEHYWTHHPVIFENAYGVETLFVCLQHTDRLLDLPRTVSDGLLEEIFEALYDPRHVYAHQWQKHDLLIWDNLTVQHARPDPTDAPRTLRRYHLSDTDLTADYLRVAREQGLV